MILAAPWLLLGLAVLPLLWWLLRALPPAPRAQSFPAIRLLAGLHTRVRDASKVPRWLLALRLLAVTLLVAGLAQPVLVGDDSAIAGNGSGPLLLVIDDGFASAPDWPARLAAARAALEQAGRARRQLVLLCTATDPSGTGPLPTAALPAGRVAALLDIATPRPWPVDRGASAKALTSAHLHGSVLYVSDGLAGPDDAALAAALAAVGPVTELRGAPKLALPGRPLITATGLSVPLLVLPQPTPRPLILSGETGAGGVLARQATVVAAGATQAVATLVLPTELRNQLERLRIDGLDGAGSVRLLDEGDRRRPVGLLSVAGADTPLLGALFYLHRALSPLTELREGTLDVLLGRQLSVLVAPDGTLSTPASRERVLAWVRQGGMLIRFAGPRLAQATTPADTPAILPDDAAPPVPPSDPLLPVPLLGGARQLGGAMSWGHPEHPAAFADNTPFAGLSVPADVTVSRQVLAEPSADLADHVWARLADGTPLVTHTAIGDGQSVLFHVTSNADWSNLPLSGLFPLLLQRLVQRAAGVAAASDETMLSPALSLAGDGQLGPPPASARPLASSALGSTPASAAHPAGLYGPTSSRRALNLADTVQELRPAIDFGRHRDLAGHRGERKPGPALLAAALLLLILDLLATLALRGLIRLPGARQAASLLLPLVLLLHAMPCLAQPGLAQPGLAQPAPPPAAALETRLAYVVTGDAETDQISRQGLEGLSSYANARTSARLGEPDGVVPGRDDLAFYPLLYWPVTPATVPAAPPAGWTAALNAYMSHGGILMIDTQGVGEPGNGNPGNGTATPAAGYVPVVPGTARSLRIATAGLDIPALSQVPQSHVLWHSFYLLHGMPGRYDGAPVWVADAEDAGNDGVSPIILGGNDWAAGWAVDPSGQNPYATIPGGEEQRVAAYRFGVNAVIYALTGNYKSDQVHVPALLRRLGGSETNANDDGLPP